MNLPNDLNLIDLVIGLILAGAFIRGLVRGLVKELFSLAALLAGWFVASRYHTHAVSLAGIRIEEGQFLVHLVVYFLLFVVTALLVVLGGKLIHKLLSDSPLGWINRLLGGACGIFVGVAIIGLLLLLITTYIPSGQVIFRDSELYRPLTAVVRLLASALPEEVRELYDRHFKGDGISLPDNFEDFI